jgi:cell division protein FtsW (lipid II flippase)
MRKPPADFILPFLALAIGAMALMGIAAIVVTDARPGDEDMLMARLGGAAFAAGGLVLAVALWRARRWAARALVWLVAVPLVLLAAGMAYVGEEEMALVVLAAALAAGGLAAFVRHRLRALHAPSPDRPRLAERPAPHVREPAARGEEERAR